MLYISIIIVLMLIIYVLTIFKTESLSRPYQAREGKLLMRLWKIA